MEKSSCQMIKSREGFKINGIITYWEMARYFIILLYSIREQRLLLDFQVLIVN